MPVINTNITALTSQQNLQKSQSSLSTSLERLSSGLRINGAEDDAAGLQIANKMTANLKASTTIEQGMDDGIGLLQTAEGGLDGINDALQRARILAVQAASGTLSNDDRSAIQYEFGTLMSEINRISYGTEVFGLTPLALATPPTEQAQIGDIRSIREIDPRLNESQPSGSVPLGFVPTGITNFSMRIDDIGANDDIQVFTRDGQHLAGTAITPNSTWDSPGVNINSPQELEASLFTSQNGFDADATYKDDQLLDGSTFHDPTTPRQSVNNGMTITYSGDGNADNDLKETLTVDNVTEPLFILVTGSGVFRIEQFDWTEESSNIVPVSESVDILTSATYGNEPENITIDPFPADTASLGIDDQAVSSQADASKAITALDNAISKIDAYRTRAGALENRLAGATQWLQQERINLEAAKSRVMDADYAQEASRLAKFQILQQASTSLLAQANQSPESVLTLLES